MSKSETTPAPIKPKDWKLKDIDPEIILKARRAAELDSLRVGAWVSRVIQEATNGKQS
jgi:hypothetical protein